MFFSLKEDYTLLEYCLLEGKNDFQLHYNFGDYEPNTNNYKPLAFIHMEDLDYFLDKFIYTKRMLFFSFEEIKKKLLTQSVNFKNPILLYDSYVKNQKFTEKMAHKFYQDDIFHDWIFGNPNAKDKKKVKQFNKWLKDHKNEECELYHGTDASLPILKEGLKKTSSKTKKSYQSQTGFVYLSIYPSMAETFGSMSYGGKKVSVYAVTLKIKELLPDKDQLHNKRRWAEIEDLGNTLAESLNVGSGARIKRNIFPYEIKLIS